MIFKGKTREIQLRKTIGAKAIKKLCLPVTEELIKLFVIITNINIVKLEQIIKKFKKFIKSYNIYW